MKPSSSAVPALLTAWILLFASGSTLADEDGCPSQAKASDKLVTGISDLLRKSLKKFATFLEADPDNLEVRLRIEGEEEPTTWTITPDAEIRVHAWWGRLRQFEEGDRVWVWFDLDRKKKPRGIFMLADETSEQDIHGRPPTLAGVDIQERTIALKPSKGDPRTLALPHHVRVQKRGEEFEFSVLLARGLLPLNFRCKLNDKVFVQSAAGTARLLLNEEALRTVRGLQKKFIRARWKEEGLPSTVTFLHRLVGEMELMLDHEGLRWGRYLKPGDKIELRSFRPAEGSAPIKAVVKHVRAWRERTRLHLAVSGFDQGDLSMAERVHARVPEPPLEVQDSELPSDLGRTRRKGERVDWFLANTYCSCNVGGDGCTGMFYTLASCTQTKCGMPNKIRARLTELIDEGMGDEQILEKLLEERGPLVLKQHLLR